MADLWNAGSAAECLPGPAKKLLYGQSVVGLLQTCPCAETKVLCDGWYETVREDG